MNYFVLHYFFMCCICNRIISGYSAQRPHNYDIDDFIQQLLSSQKFDELADKVADKAVNKMKYMESAGTYVRNTNDNEEPQHRYQEKTRNIEDGTYNGAGQRSTNNEDNVKPGSINTQALLKKEDSSQSDTLTLKYTFLKKQSHDGKPYSEHHMGSNEHRPIWKNVENLEQNLRLKKASGEEKEREIIQPIHGSAEKNNFNKNNNFENNDNYDKNINFDRNINYDKNNNFDKNYNIDKNYHYDKTMNINTNINYDKNSNFDRNDNYDKNINFDRNINNEKINNFDKNLNYDKNKYYNYDRPGNTYDNERNRFERENENEGIKNTFVNDHGDEHSRDNRNNDRGREESNERFKPEYDQNSRPQIKTEHNPSPSVHLQLKESPEDSPSLVIDLDDNNGNNNNKAVGAEDNKNAYREIVEQKTTMNEYRDNKREESQHMHDDEEHRIRDEEEHKMRDENEHKMRVEDEYKERNDDQHKMHDEDQHKMQDEDSHKTRDSDEHKMRDEGEQKTRDSVQYNMRDEDEHQTRGVRDSWKGERQVFPEDADTDEDENMYKTPQNADAVTSTTRKRLIRREGNQFYTYLSAPEYAEYHEALAKQTKHQNQFDIM